MISIKRHIDREPVEAMIRLAEVLLHGITLHAIEGAPDEHAQFREKMDETLRRVGSASNERELLLDAGSALTVVGDHNRRTAEYLRLPQVELQGMVRMLSEAVAQISAAGESNVTALRKIERRVSAALAVEDIRQAREELAGCLREIQIEGERQRAQTLELLSRLSTACPGAESAGPKPEGELDEVTGLYRRGQAETALLAACQSNARHFVLIVALDRVQLINERFGFSTGDEVLRYYSGYLRRQLPARDQLFRWNGPAFLAVAERPVRLEIVRDEWARLMAYKYEHTIRTASRTVLLPISVRWTVFPAMAAARLLMQKIDAFVAAPSHSD